MPRPLRIEYEDAYYHVMNRGRGRQNIFHSEEYYEEFLKTLEEANSRFGVEVLSYCLMRNHYHLLLKTPEGNLGRVMRHINGVYTQRHNRMKKTDGTLFRGRYKAISVEEDSYQLQVSRYIHRNPVEAKIVDSAEEYRWSSYKYFVSAQVGPKWLFKAEIYAQLGTKRSLRESYRAYTELGTDEEIAQFYAKGNLMPYLGSEEFRGWAYSQRVTEEGSVSAKSIAGFKRPIKDVVEEVAKEFGVESGSILKGSRGESNIPRWVAMHICQQVWGYRLVEIASEFGLRRIGSIPTTIKKLKELMKTDKGLCKLVGKLNSKV